MSNISPGPASNAQMNANVQYEGRATDAFEQGKEKLGLDSSNGSAQMAGHAFEQRVANDPGH